MDFLSRDEAPFTPEQWAKVDEVVVQTAKQVLTGRKLIHMYGPLGAGVQSVHIDDFGAIGQGEVDFFGESDGPAVKTLNRRFAEIPLVYKDFSLAWRDMENSRQLGLPLDLSAAANAAAQCARKEDELIFLGNSALGYEGLLNVAGATRLAKQDWREGENAFLDIAGALAGLTGKGFVGKFALVVSPDLYMQMQRLQPVTGLLEIERVKQLLDGNLYQTAVLGSNKAVLVCAEPQNMDLVVGQDMITGYLGPEKLNHAFRILETILLRVKRKDAVVIFE
ncbi:MAG TPA: family 1 encapsulin nanocompartment shell protein [Selenomonadales bacterium]|nr:family 1 encapsulin nanocompartment shell protein [Selenomonadales bacterium]